MTMIHNISLARFVNLIEVGCDLICCYLRLLSYIMFIIYMASIAINVTTMNTAC